MPLERRDVSVGEGMRILKDACVLGAITLASGLLLGAVYVVTKDPIAQQEQAKKMNAYGRERRQISCSRPEGMNMSL